MRSVAVVLQHRMERIATDRLIHPNPVFRLYIKVQRKFPIQRLRSATPIAHTRQPAESEKITQGLPTLLDATPQTIAALSRPLSAMKVTANTVRGRRPRILVVEGRSISCVRLKKRKDASLI